MINLISTQFVKSLIFLCIMIFALTSCSGSGTNTGSSVSLCPNGTNSISPASTTPTSTGDFKFIVFGDFNGGGCDRNARVESIVNSMSQEEGIAFFVSTGDLIDGYGQYDGSTSCFASKPSTNSQFTTVCSPEGNIAEIMSPIKDRCPPAGLEAHFIQLLVTMMITGEVPGIQTPVVMVSVIF